MFTRKPERQLNLREQFLENLRKNLQKERFKSDDKKLRQKLKKMLDEGTLF